MLSMVRLRYTKEEFYGDLMGTMCFNTYQKPNGALFIYNVGSVNSGTTGDFTTSSTTPVDLTNATITISTLLNNHVLTTFTGTVQQTNVSVMTWFQIVIDGTAATFRGVGTDASNAGVNRTVALQCLSGALTAGSHTFKIQVSTDANTMRIQSSESSPRKWEWDLSAIEIG